MVVFLLEPFILLTLCVTPISDVQNAVKQLLPLKSVGLAGTRSFIVKGCTESFVPVVLFISNHSLSFPNLWKQAAVVPAFKKSRSSSVSNYRSAAILNNFPTVYEFIIQEHFSVLVFLI
jgi:hypothetical protein